MPEGMNYIRTPELLKRWSEFSAFGFGKICSIVWVDFYCICVIVWRIYDLKLRCHYIAALFLIFLMFFLILCFLQQRLVPHAHRILHLTSGCPSIRQCREYGTLCGVCRDLWSVERLPLGADAGGRRDGSSAGQVSIFHFECSSILRYINLLHTVECEK